MTAEQLLKDGRPAEALKELQKAVRDDPANAKSRVFLFQLFSVQGDWNRADTQLKVLADMDSDSMMLSRIPFWSAKRSARTSLPANEHRSFLVSHPSGLDR
jgi:protein involved in temperature-dependent protein secretion